MATRLPGSRCSTHSAAHHWRPRPDGCWRQPRRGRERATMSGIVPTAPTIDSPALAAPTRHGRPCAGLCRPSPASSGTPAAAVERHSFGLLVLTQAFGQPGIRSNLHPGRRLPHAPRATSRGHTSEEIPPRQERLLAQVLVSCSNATHAQPRHRTSRAAAPRSRSGRVRAPRLRRRRQGPPPPPHPHRLRQKRRPDAARGGRGPGP